MGFDEYRKIKQQPHKDEEKWVENTAVIAELVVQLHRAYFLPYTKCALTVRRSISLSESRAALQDFHSTIHFCSLLIKGPTHTEHSSICQLRAEVKLELPSSVLEVRKPHSKSR